MAKGGRGKYTKMKKAQKDAKTMQEQSGFGLKDGDCERCINGLVDQASPPPYRSWRLASIQIKQEEPSLPEARCNLGLQTEQYACYRRRYCSSLFPLPRTQSLSLKA